ncbi:MAG: YsnF/AvaK domain-containing protein, partial [Nitrososphaeraceae archaeon]
YYIRLYYKSIPRFIILVFHDLFMSSSSSSIDWSDVIKKEARGSDDEDLGEVQEVGQDYVLVQRGMINKDKFYIPKDMVESYDGDVLRFSISEEDAKSRFLGDSPPTSSSSSSANEGLTAAIKAEETTTVPITEERLDASKRESTREATITKEPVTETKTVEVPVTHEEISVERRPASGSTTTAAERPVQSKTETKVPLKQEEVQVTKQPYVKEEVSVKKKPVTEKRTVSEKVTSEKVKVKGKDVEEEEEEET